MLRRLALLTLLGAVSACDAPSQATPSPPPPPQAAPPAVLSEQRVRELSERCERKAREGFRREWRDGAVKTAEGPAIAAFASRYNRKLDTCFYLLTVSRQGGASSATLSRTLTDIDEGELYGEYLGPATDESPPARTPDRCRVVSLYCASGREWDALAAQFMEN